MVHGMPLLTEDRQLPFGRLAGKRHPRWYSVCAGFLFVGIIASLLGLNYYGQRRLQHETLRLLQVDLAARADALNYFIMERENDLQGFASSSQVAAYLNSNALGMSMDYGRNGGLDLISRQFASLNDSSRWGGKPVWSRLALFSNAGKLILAHQPPQSTSTHLHQIIDAPISASQQSAVLDPDNPFFLRITSPVIHNGSQLGLVAGWVALESLHEQFLQTQRGQDEKPASFDIIVLDGSKGGIAAASEETARLPAELVRLLLAEGGSSSTQLAPGIQSLDEHISYDTKGVVAVYHPVPDMNARLVRIIEQKFILGSANPTRFLITLAGISAVVIGVIVLLVRYSTQVLVLAERLNEVSSNRTKIQIMNADLAVEVQNRSKAEDELAREKALLHSLIEGIPDPIFHMDQQLRCAGGNPAFLKLFGIDEKNLKGRGAREIFDAETAELFEQHCREVLETGEMLQDDYWVDLPDGQCLLLETKITPYMKEKEDSTGLICISRDITDRKWMQMALESQKERLDLVILGTNIGVWDWNVQTGETVFNDRWAEIVGYTLAELAPVSVETWLKLMHPEDHKRSDMLLEKHFGGKLDFYDCESRMRHKAGHWVWVHCRGRVMEWTQDGLPLRMSGTLSDITSRKSAEDAFKESQERLITAIEALDDGFVLYDADDRLVLHNRRYLELYSETKEFISVGERFEDIIRKGVEKGQYADAVGNEEQWVAERIQQHLSPASTIEQKLADGTWLRISERRTRDGGVVGFRVDITDLKKVESRLREANETLEARVQERASRLEEMHTQMVLQEKMASVGQLAAGMAHELNNPINFVNGNFIVLSEYITDMTEMIEGYRMLVDQAASSGWNREATDLLREKEDELELDYILGDVPELFEESQRGFDRIVRIIDSMRDFSHVDQGSQLMPFDINKCIQDTLVIARNTYKYCAVVEEYLDDMPKVICLPEQLNQVFLNLIVNSMQAIEAQQRNGKGRITIRTWSEGGGACCEIADDGPGIPEEIRNRVFEPFFTTKPPGKGTGLGLSICYDIIVEKHKGTLTLNCPPEGGSVFTIRIPFV